MNHFLYIDKVALTGISLFYYLSTIEHHLFLCLFRFEIEIKKASKILLILLPYQNHGNLNQKHILKVVCIDCFDIQIFLLAEKQYFQESPVQLILRLIRLYLQV